MSIVSTATPGTITSPIVHQVDIVSISGNTITFTPASSFNVDDKVIRGHMSRIMCEDPAINTYTRTKEGSYTSNSQSASLNIKFSRRDLNIERTMYGNSSDAANMFTKSLRRDNAIGFRQELMHAFWMGRNRPEIPGGVQRPETM